MRKKKKRSVLDSIDRTEKLRQNRNTKSQQRGGNRPYNNNAENALPVHNGIKSTLLNQL